MSETPDLPSAYNLIALEHVDSVRAEARRQADNGAEEGTLIWSRAQDEVRGPLGETMESPAGNLYCALVFRPELSPGTAMELSYVLAISLGSAIASLAAPMMELKYRWPHLILLNQSIVGSVDLDWETADDNILRWLVADIRVNVESHLFDENFTYTGLVEEGCAGLKPEKVLEGFSRQLLAEINRWNEDDFEQIRKRWYDRMESTEDLLALHMKNESLSGKFVELCDNGDAVLQLENDRQRRIDLTEFFKT